MTKDDLNSLAWPALRYALGRKTYVVDTVARALIANARSIRHDLRQGMIEDIEEAIDQDMAGMEMDVITWRKVLDALKN